MTSTQSTAGRTGVKPQERAPKLVVDLVGGGSWDLAAQQPEEFTLIVFYRGHHCPVCRAQLSEINRRSTSSSSAASASSPSAATTSSSPAKASATGTSTGSRSATA